MEKEKADYLMTLRVEIITKAGVWQSFYDIVAKYLVNFRNNTIEPIIPTFEQYDNKVSHS